MANSENATAKSDLIELRAALEHVASAAMYLKAARAAFGEDERAQPDRDAVRAVVLGAENSLRRGIENLGSLHIDGVAYRNATPVEMSLYDTFDTVVVVATVLKARKLPDGKGLSICPVAGALSAIIERLALNVLAVESLLSLVSAQSARAKPVEKLMAA